MGEDNKKLIEKLKRSPRYSDLCLKLEKAQGFLNQEEISLLNIIVLIEAQDENRNQMENTRVLSEETIRLSKESLQTSIQLARSTKWLAIATISLAGFTFLLVLTTIINIFCNK